MEARNPRILIVEDDLVLAMVEARMVEELGYEVAGKARSGEEAIELARKNQPDAILMDIKLRGNIDGFEAIEKIFNFLQVPVIYISGHSTEDSYKEAHKIGCAEFLVKPIRSKDLSTALINVFRAECGSSAAGNVASE